LTPASSTIEAAVQDGLKALGSGVSTGKGESLEGSTVGVSVHVDSVDPSSPSYELVDINKSGKTVAVAKVGRRPSHRWS
jgi:hypothetical protein